MTSRNSFLASLKENNKRRIWLWLLSMLGFVVALPTATAFTISRGMTSKNHYYETFGEVLGAQKIREYLMGRVQAMLGLDNVLWLFVAAFAIISAIQGFSYLYHRNKIDFYMGMPVKRSKRFLVIWLNGIVAYMIPYLLGILLSCLIALVNNVMSGEIFLEAMLAYGAYFCFYLGVYHLTILAVMMTGNMVITCFATAVFFLYEVVARMTIQGYMVLFYKFYSGDDYNTEPALSPFTMLFRFVEEVNDRANGRPFLQVVYLLLFAAVIGLIAYICYLKRPAEAAGKALAFSLPKPWIKILIAVPITLITGILVSDIVGYNPNYGEGKVGYIIFSMAVVLLVVCCLMQVIYEFDIRGIWHSKRHILISAVLTVAIFIVFRYDLTGYDTYIPKAEEVESAAFISPIGSYSYYGESYFDENMESMSRAEYMSEYMYLTDVGTVNKLLKKSIDAAKKMDDMDEFSQQSEEEGQDWRNVTVKYRMANKRTVSRRIYVNLADAETVELIDRIESSEEFITGAYVGASDILINAFHDERYQIGAVYGNGIYETKLSKEEAGELLTLYKKDIMKTGFVQQREQIPGGSLVINMERKLDGYTITNQSELKIYPFFEGCVSYLKEKGYYMEMYVNPEDIERIQIVNYNNEMAEKLAKEQQEAEVMSPGELLHAQAYPGAEVVLVESASSTKTELDAPEIDVRKYATYESEEEIRQIADALYPAGWIYRGWHMNRERADDYAITIYFKPDSEIAKSYGSVMDYCFIADQVPDFVEADTVYTE